MQMIREGIQAQLKKLKMPVVNFKVEHPKDEQHGDYSTNVVLVLAKEVGIKPREVAEKIWELLANDIEMNRLIEKIEVAGAGFINFYLKKEYLIEEAGAARKKGYGKNKQLAGQRIMVEYTDPNPFKEMHIGHLMSNTIGESLARILIAQGAEVKRANYQGDVGLHVAKAIWGIRQELGMRKLELGELEKWELKERQKLMGQAYALGATRYEEDEEVKKEIHELNLQIYQRSNAETNKLYDVGREWSLAYFETIYARLGTKFDEYFFESEAGPVGLEVVKEGLAKGVLEVGEEGAVVYKGEKDHLHTRVFRNKLGLPTYEAKDLGLAKTKYGRYSYDRSYIVTANEITEYFKVVLRVMKQLYPELAAKTTHIPHGMMKLVSGKMSSRTGKVITGEGLLNDLKAVVQLKMGEREIKERERVADMVAVGALKYTVLRQAIGGDIVYEPEKMTNLEGDTGPYLQYTFARAKSVLAKSEITRDQPSQL
ncbi:MAG: Arginine-tRNA ligase, partial [Microgenomates group bacterium GW2011_GWD1_47_13]